MKQSDFTHKTKYLSLMMYLFLCYMIIYSVICSCFIFAIDNAEFIHSSWLASIGKMPYVDFFQHHNPLLWYLYAPVTQLFERSVYIIYVTNFFVIFSYIILLILVYHINKNYLYGTLAAQFSVIFFCFVPFLDDIPEFSFDLFMLICQIASLSFLFKYLQSRHCWSLTVSYLLQAVAFLIIQKAVFLGLAFALSQVYLIYKKELSIKNFLCACFLPVVILGSFFVWLYIKNALYAWYQLCILFNSDMRLYYGNYTDIPTYYYYILAVFVICIIRFYKASIQGNVLMIHLLVSLLSVLYFAPHGHYLYSSCILIAILISPFISELFKKYHQYILPVLVGLYFVCFVNSLDLITKIQKGNRIIKTVEYVIKNTQKNDVLINGISPTYLNLFNEDADFLWFGFHNVGIVYDLNFAPNRPFDYNELVRKVKPKFLYGIHSEFDGISFFNTKWIAYYNTMISYKFIKHQDEKDWFFEKRKKFNWAYWKLDREFIESNYHKVDNPDLIDDLWVRNDENIEDD